MAKSTKFRKFEDQQIDSKTKKVVKGGFVYYKNPVADIMGQTGKDWNDIEIRNDNPWTKKFGKANSLVAKIFGR